GARPAYAEAARRGRAARVRAEDGSCRDRAGGAADAGLRGRGRGNRCGKGDSRPARPCSSRHGLRRPVSVLAARGLVHALPRSRLRRRAQADGVLGPRHASPLRRYADERSRDTALNSSHVAYEFKLPDLGEGLTEGEVARWLVAEGDEIAEDDPLVEIQTDKTTVEIPSPAGGTVLRILIAEGQVAPVGTVLVVIGNAGEQLLR